MNKAKARQEIAKVASKLGLSVQFKTSEITEEADGIRVLDASTKQILAQGTLKLNASKTDYLDSDVRKTINQMKTRLTSSQRQRMNSSKDSNLYRYFAYDEKGNPVGEGFAYREDAVEYAKSTGCLVVKSHKYFVDDSDRLRPDGDPVTIWSTESPDCSCRRRRRVNSSVDSAHRMYQDKLGADRWSNSPEYKALRKRLDEEVETQGVPSDELYEAAKKVGFSIEEVKSKGAFPYAIVPMSCSEGFDSEQSAEQLNQLLDSDSYESLYEFLAPFEETVMQNVNDALAEYGVYSEPSIQSGRGEDFIFDLDTDEELGSIDYEEEMYALADALLNNDFGNGAVDDMVQFILEAVGIPGSFNSAKNSRRDRKLNCSEDTDDFTGEDADFVEDVESIVTDEAGNEIPVGEMLVVQDLETKEISLFIPTTDDDTVPESVEVIGEVTPANDEAVLDSSRRLSSHPKNSKCNSDKETPEGFDIFGRELVIRGSDKPENEEEESAMANEIAELGGTLKRSRSESHYTTPGRVFVSRSLVYIIRVPNDIYNDDLKHQFEEVLKKYNRSGKLKKVGSYSNGDIKLKEA